MKKILLLLIFLSALGAESFYYERGEKVVLTPVVKKAPALRENSQDDITYYENSSGQRLGLKNQILIKVEEGVDVSALALKYDVIFIKALSASIYLLEVKSGDNVFEKSSLLYEDDQTLLAQPNFSRKRVLR